MRFATSALWMTLALVPTIRAAGPDAPPPSKVIRVVDGDTVVVELDGHPTTVRLIGVDVPESVHPRKPVERFGVESSKFLHGLLDGRSVRLEYEPGPSRLDRYGRTLAYLVRDDDLAVNREIIARGYGVAYTRFPFRPDGGPSGRRAIGKGGQARALGARPAEGRRGARRDNGLRHQDRDEVSRRGVSPPGRGR